MFVKCYEKNVMIEADKRNGLNLNNIEIDTIKASYRNIYQLCTYR